MTVSTTTIKNSYSGDGSTTQFTYTFKITDQDDIEVVFRDTVGQETVKTITTDYTVSGVGNAGGGTVTFNTAPASGFTVVLRRITPQTQGLDLIENDPLPANSLEDAFDKLTSIGQELQEEIDRSIKFSKTNTINNTEFTLGPTERANKILSFDSNGEITVGAELGTFKGSWSAGVLYSERDIVRDGSNGNIYFATTAHTSAGSTPLSGNAQIGNWELIVDTANAQAAATSAAASASSATASASAASADAATAAAQAGLATQAKTDAEQAKTDATQAKSDAEQAELDAQTAQSAAEAAAASAAASAQSAANSIGGGTVAITASDTNANYLQDKILVSAGMKTSVENSGGDEKLKITDSALIFSVALGG